MLRGLLRASPADRRLAWRTWRKLRRTRRALRRDAPTEMARARAVPLGKGDLEPRKVRWAVRAVSRRMHDTKCLPQAIVALELLRGSGHDAALHIGARKEEAFEAHAWVELDGEVVVGHLPDLGSYHRMA